MVKEGKEMAKKEKLNKSKADKRRQKILAGFEAARKLSADETAKWLDEEVAANVSRLIWKTAHLMPQEQAERFIKAGHCFHWVSSTDCWFAADVASRIFHDEEALKLRICRDLPTDRDDDADYLAQSIHHANYIHFQMTKAFNGGFDAYIVFRITETARTIVVRICR